MKTYKLIKEYPNSPKIGTTITRRTKGEKYWSYDNLAVVLFEKDTPEIYPEFWKEVVPKDYEILSFINLDNKLIYSKGTNEVFYSHGNTSRNLNYCLKYYRIHSIKRLSDGEIFTINDSVIYPHNQEGTICSIFLGNNFRGDECLWLRVYEETLRIHLVEKNKKPLFKTYDNVDIFEGDTFYYMGDAFNICETRCYFKGVEDFTKFKTFAKKENAKNYKEENQKKYSKNDIKEIVKNLGCFGTTLIEYLENN